MSVHTAEFQTIEYQGVPAFVLVPVDLFARIKPLLEMELFNHAIPHEIVRRNAVDDVPMVRAWREYLGLTQNELARRVGMTQPAIAKLERPGARPRHGTLSRIAAALELTPEQLAE